jgi:hypothetical protein
MLVPPTQSILMPRSSSAWSTPRWAKPRAPPPLKHQADRGAALQARQAFEVLFSLQAHVHVVGEGAALQPAPHLPGRCPLFPVQQHQHLHHFGHLRVWRAVQQEGTFGGVHLGRLRRVGHQQQLVAVTRATARPGAGPVVTHQQHKVGAGFDLVQHQRHQAGQFGAFVLQTGTVRLQRGLHGTGIDRLHTAQAPQGRRQPQAEGRHVDLIADGQQPQRHRPLQQRGRLLAEQAANELLRHRSRHQGVVRVQFVEGLLAQAHQHAFADGHHAGRTRLAGEQAHLAKDLPARELAHHALYALFVAHIGPQAAAHRQVQRIARRTLLDKRFAARHVHPLQALAQQRQGVVVDAAEATAQQAVKQGLLVGVAFSGRGHGIHF